MFIFILIAGCSSKTAVKNPHTTYTKGKNYPALAGDGVIFKLYAPDAVLVTLAGTFNGWSGIITEMKKDETGLWSVKLPLRKGRYLYKFVLDGYWIPDPDNPDIESDGGKSVNSIIIVE